MQLLDLNHAAITVLRAARRNLTVLVAPSYQQCCPTESFPSDARELASRRKQLLGMNRAISSPPSLLHGPQPLSGRQLLKR